MRVAAREQPGGAGRQAAAAGERPRRAKRQPVWFEDHQLGSVMQHSSPPVVSPTAGAAARKLPDQPEGSLPLRRLHRLSDLELRKATAIAGRARPAAPAGSDDSSGPAAFAEEDQPVGQAAVELADESENVCEEQMQQHNIEVRGIALSSRY